MVNKTPKMKINIHVELIKLSSSDCFDFSFAKVGINTDEKIIEDIPVTIAGIDNILKQMSISTDAPNELAKTI